MSGSRGGKGPKGASRPPRSRRPGRAGVGPGPAYRPTSSGGGTKHGSSSGTRVMAWVAAAIFGLPVLVVVGLGAYVVVVS